MVVADKVAYQRILSWLLIYHIYIPAIKLLIAAEIGRFQITNFKYLITTYFYSTVVKNKRRFIAVFYRPEN